MLIGREKFSLAMALATPPTTTDPAAILTEADGPSRTPTLEASPQTLEPTLKPAPPALRAAADRGGKGTSWAARDDKSAPAGGQAPPPAATPRFLETGHPGPPLGETATAGGSAARLKKVGRLTPADAAQLIVVEDSGIQEWRKGRGTAQTADFPGTESSATEASMGPGREEGGHECKDSPGTAGGKGEFQGGAGHRGGQGAAVSFAAGMLRGEGGGEALASHPEGGGAPELERSFLEQLLGEVGVGEGVALGASSEGKQKPRGRLNQRGEGLHGPGPPPDFPPFVVGSEVGGPGWKQRGKPSLSSPGVVEHSLWAGELAELFCCPISQVRRPCNSRH